MYLRFRVLLLIILVGLTACETLKESKPLIPMKDYEKMIAGRFDADYVGTNNCLRACHYHDNLKRDFEASTMGAQMSSTSGMPLVDCESCHGPGSLAIANITPEKVEEAARQGKQLACDYKTLIDIKALPPRARSLICLKCHTANASFNLHNWEGGIHSLNAVTCTDCHDVHKGPDLIVSPKETFQMCFKCHQQVQAEFSLTEHHPVPEGKVYCTDCHDPHGTINEHQLRKETVRETCTACHGDKEGPYTFEHADLMEACTNCHRPHGSPNLDLLVVTMPFLCLQCHEGHRTSPTASVESKQAFFTRCTDCHSQIHGTDTPGPDGQGRFTR